MMRPRHTTSASSSAAASSSFDALGADAQQLVLHACSFESLQHVLAVSHALHEHAMAVLQSSAWRAIPANEAALTRAAWTEGEVEEACLGADGKPLTRLAVEGRTIATATAADNREAASGAAPIRSWQLKVWDAVDARCTHQFGTAGLVLDVALGDGVVAALVAPSVCIGPTIRLFDLHSGPSTAVGGTPLDTTPLLPQWIAWHRQRLVVCGRLQQPPPSAGGACGDDACRGHGLQTYLVPAGQPTRASLQSAALLPATPAVTPGQPHTPILALSGSLAVILTRPSGTRAVAALVLSFPDLAPLRTLAVGADLLPYSEGRSHLLGLDAAWLAIGTHKMGRVLLWDLAPLVADDADVADAVHSLATADGGRESTADATMADATSAASSVGGSGGCGGCGGSVLPVAHVQPPWDERDRPDTSSATRSRGPGVVVCLSLRRGLLAACVNLRGVYVWDCASKAMLRRVELPSRTCVAPSRPVSP